MCAESLLSNKADIELIDFEGNLQKNSTIGRIHQPTFFLEKSALHLAVEGSHDQVVQLLLNHGASEVGEDKDGKHFFDLHKVY